MQSLCVMKATLLAQSAYSISANGMLAARSVSYWTGIDYWNRGYCTEAFTRRVPYAHEELGITKVVARCSAQNAASARVMEKTGLKREGLLLRHSLKHGQFDDVLVY